MKERGFTLIELLVVTAIIGILASIVLVSLGGARDRAKDAKIVTSMSQLRSTAEIFRGSGGDYVNLCSNADVAVLSADINNQGGVSYNCQVDDTGDTYCVEVQLNSDKWWCVDSNLKSKQYDDNPACATAQAVKNCE